ncbi:hypothetical protein Goari_019032 [Gossypium aridum]|uniref:Plus3 domain-containing protein n=1 Tax=Gossypium aridum TaxID=34290 RepID=A0A7J8WRH0_GOSAI|nr:hypothetical protein [Gossypium aridum]
MNVDHCRKVPLTEDSNLVDVAVRGDGGGMGEVKLGNGVKVVEMKRRRGRPPKNPARNMSAPAPAPVTVRKKDEEDVCFICFDGGSLVLCDRHLRYVFICAVYIVNCMGFYLSVAVLRRIIRLASKGTKHSLDQRRNGTVGGIYVALVRRLHIICAIRVRIPCARIALKVQVDFDDKTSWEYLFKMYWVFLKEKLSLTLDELTKAKNPWKENAIMEKPFGDLGASFSKRRKMLKQQAFFNKVESVEAEKPGITKNHLRPTDIISKRSEAVATQMAVLGNSDGPPIIAIDTRCKTHEKVDEKGQKANPDEFAAIDVHNMNLIYLRRSLMENLIDDVEKFNDKVVGSFVRIRIPCDQKQDIYRLVQVVGTIKAAEPYKIGEKTIDVMIEILNLDKKELVSINGISNQELSEDECQQLRQSIIKSGQIKWFTVGEILEKAMALQAVRVNDVSSLTSELQLINDCV